MTDEMGKHQFWQERRRANVHGVEVTGEGYRNSQQQQTTTTQIATTSSTTSTDNDRTEPESAKLYSLHTDTDYYRHSFIHSFVRSFNLSISLILHLQLGQSRTTQ